MNLTASRRCPNGHRKCLRLACWLRPVGQAIVSVAAALVLPEREPLPFPLPPPEPKYPEGYTYTNDGSLVIWECQGCGYAFVFTTNYDPPNVIHNLTVHRIRCALRPIQLAASEARDVAD